MFPPAGGAMSNPDKMESPDSIRYQPHVRLGFNFLQRPYKSVYIVF